MVSARFEETALRSSTVLSSIGKLSRDMLPSRPEFWRSIETKSKLTSYKYFFLWFVWMFIGTIFYAYAPGSDLGFWKGLFMSVNIGYSIGYGYPTEAKLTHVWFSIFHVLIGASFVGVALGFYAESVVKEEHDWFTNLMLRNQYKRKYKETREYAWKFRFIAMKHATAIKASIFWLCCVVCMTCYSGYIHNIDGQDWNIEQRLYFALSSLSTGGHYGIPEYEKRWLFGVTAFVNMVGVPVMAIAMASIAKSFLEHWDTESLSSKLYVPVTGEELVMLRHLGLENGDGSIDKSEFIILCMLRWGGDPKQVLAISKRFDELDLDGNGDLSIEEITGGKYSFEDGQIVAVGGQDGNNESEKTIENPNESFSILTPSNLIKTLKSSTNPFASDILFPKLEQEDVVRKSNHDFINVQDFGDSPPVNTSGIGGINVDVETPQVADETRFSVSNPLPVSNTFWSEKSELSVDTWNESMASRPATGLDISFHSSRQTRTRSTCTADEPDLLLIGAPKERDLAEVDL